MKRIEISQKGRIATFNGPNVQNLHFVYTEPDGTIDLPVESHEVTEITDAAWKAFKKNPTMAKVKGLKLRKLFKRGENPGFDKQLDAQIDPRVQKNSDEEIIA